MKKILPILLLLVLVTPFFTSCEEQNKRKEFVVGMECDYSPYNWTQGYKTDIAFPISGHESAGYCSGYDVYISKIIADSIDRDLVVKKIEWDGLPPALTSGEIDAIIAGMTFTPERENGSIDFVKPTYSIGNMVMVVKKDSIASTFTDIQQFANMKVIGQKNTSYDKVIDQIKNVDHLTPLSSYTKILESIKNNEAVGSPAETPVALGAIETNPELTILKFDKNKGFDLDKIGETANASVAMKTGSRGSELFNQVSDAVSKITDDEKNRLMQQAVDNHEKYITNDKGDQESTDSTQIFEKGNFFEKAYYIWENNWNVYLYGVLFTVLLAVIGTFIGLIIGLILGSIRTIKANANDPLLTKFFKNLLGQVINLYVWVFRGSPMIVQAMFLYYALKPILHWNAIFAGFVIISINTGAYMVEIIRSGIQAIPNGQLEASRSLGMTFKQVLSKIIFPQALKISFPSLGNQLVVNIKDSSLLNVIGVIELYFQTTSMAGTYALYMESFFIASILYLILTSIATFILNFIEKRIGGSDNADFLG